VAPMHPTNVRCPQCDRRIQVQPRVASVAVDSGQLTVTFHPVTVVHHEGDPPSAAGFAPPRGGPDR
jgi:DNA-directed RNA polymerase subunit RPC12/RpoP